jgi:hypothetical protein
VNARSESASPELIGDFNSVCFREPIPEILDAARELDAAVTAHLAGDYAQAEHYIRSADKPVISEWVESILGKRSPYVHVRNVPCMERLEVRASERMPTAAEKWQLHERDGYHCRFCGLPVIRAEVRRHMQKDYPDVLRWGRRNTELHSAFFAMWVQYDHLLPHSRGGTNELDNLLITCSACNYGRGGYTLGEVGLSNPFDRPVIKSKWDGLERFKRRPLAASTT